MRCAAPFGAIALAVVLATPAFGQECGSDRRGPSRYCFALDLIETLRIAHNAYKLYGDSIGLATCFTGGAVDVIYRAKQREQSFRQALTVLRASASSPDSSIHLSGQALAFAYATNLSAALDEQRRFRARRGEYAFQDCLTALAECGTRGFIGIVAVCIALCMKYVTPRHSCCGVSLWKRALRPNPRA